MNYSLRILCVTLCLVASCKTAHRIESTLTDDEHSNIENTDFRELEAKPPHLSNGLIDVKHYDVSLGFPSMESSEIKAKASVQLKLLKADRHVRLHMEKSTLKISSVALQNDSREVPLKFRILDGLAGDKGLSGSVLRVDLPSEQPAGAELQLTLNYIINKPAKGATKGMMHRVDFNGEPIYATRNWPYYARYWLPSNDHPADTATFHFKLSVPQNAVAAANGELIGGNYRSGQGIGPDGLRQFEWSLKTPIPVYGVSVVVGKLDVIDELICFDPSKKLSLNTVPCSTAPLKIPYVYFIQRRHSERKEFLDQAKDGIKQMILMSSILGPYPYQKLGFVAAPQDFNMESVSMMMMISPEATTHEVAHHWWGNTVYIEHWGDLWISEGLTSYFTGFYNEIAKGRYEECSSTKGILNNPPDTDPLKIFDDTPYCKGAAAIADLRTTLEDLASAAGQRQKGRDGFLQVMKDLYESYKFKRLGSKTLVQFLQSNSTKSLAKVGIKIRQDNLEQAITAWQKKWLTAAKK